MSTRGTCYRCAFWSIQIPKLAWVLILIKLHPPYWSDSQNPSTTQGIILKKNYSWWVKILSAKDKYDTPERWLNKLAVALNSTTGLGQTNTTPPWEKFKAFFKKKRYKSQKVPTQSYSRPKTHSYKCLEMPQGV